MIRLLYLVAAALVLIAGARSVDRVTARMATELSDAHAKGLRARPLPLTPTLPRGPLTWQT